MYKKVFLLFTVLIVLLFVNETVQAQTQKSNRTTTTAINNAFLPQKPLRKRPPATPAPTPSYPTQYTSSSIGGSLQIPYAGPFCIVPYFMGFAVNDSGYVGGYVGYCTASGSHEDGAGLYNPLLNESFVISPGTQYAQPYGINNNGEVVGVVANGGINPFIYHISTGTFEQITLGFETPYQGAFYDINDSGMASGIAAGLGAITWQNGQMTVLGTLSGDSQAFGLAINNAGWVVGYSGTSSQPHAFMLFGTPVIVEMPFPAGTVASMAKDINNQDQIVGFYTSSDGVEHAFLRHNGTLTDLGRLDPNSTENRALAISDTGQVVGYSQRLLDGNLRQRAFIWDPLNGMRDLNDVAPTYTEWGTPVSLGIAAAISKNGNKIVARQSITSQDSYLLTAGP